MSRLPEEFVLTCSYSQFALSATNAVRVAPIDASKSRLFLHLHREIVTPYHAGQRRELTCAILFFSSKSGE